MSDQETVEFLASVPLLAGRDSTDLTELSRVLRRKRVAAGEPLWRQGDSARELMLIEHGEVAASLRATGGRDVEVARIGPGEVVGELAVLDGGRHTMGIHATEPTTVFILGAADFTALLTRHVPSSFALKRRLAAVFIERHRSQLARLAASLGLAEAAAADGALALAALPYCGPPDSKYIRRMATFHDFDSLALWGFLTSGSYAMCPPGHTLVAEGVMSEACFLTINGAVEKVLVRGEKQVRIGLAGPGKAFGYESLIDGLPSPVTAVTRERSLLLVLPSKPFAELFNGENAVSRVFLDVVQRDLVATLRETLRPHARLAASL